MNTTELRETAMDLQEKAEETCRQWTERAIENARAAGVNADYYVHENVWTTVALAGLTGFVVGYLLGRSSD